MNTIIIFGAGMCGKKYYKYLTRFLGVSQQIFFFDSDPMKQGSDIDGVKVLTTAMIGSVDKSCACVVICNFNVTFIDQMVETALHAGFRQEDVYINYDYYCAVPLTEFWRIAEILPSPALERYRKEYPSNQIGVDIFKGEWAAEFPSESGVVTGGYATDVFNDTRLNWALSELGSIEDKNILELGYLEAFHTYMLEKGGAQCITCIDANTHSYMKSLITKEVMKIKKARFLCGDFVRYLEECGDIEYDLIVASGVLYHMENPIRLLCDISMHTNAVYIWTHCFTDDFGASTTNNFLTNTYIEYNGYGCIGYRNEYGSALQGAGYMGGGQPYSYWLRLEDIVECLKYFGFKAIKTNEMDNTTKNGPSICILAKKN